MGLYRRDDSPTWWMSFCVNKRQYKRSTGTADKKMAEVILGKIKAQVIEGKWFEVDEAKQHTFDELMEKFMREYAPLQEITTQMRYKSSLKNLSGLFHGMLLADITPSAISNYLQSRREQGVSSATRNKEFNMLSKAFNLAWKQWEWCDENPCIRVQKAPENNLIDRWLTEDEYQRLIGKSAGYLNGQLTDIITFALHTGIRLSEILNLKWSDVDLFRKVITVLKTKNKSPKTIPMTDTTHELLLRKRQGQGKVVSISGYVFATSTPYKKVEKEAVLG